MHPHTLITHTLKHLDTQHATNANSVVGVKISAATNRLSVQYSVWAPDHRAAGISGVHKHGSAVPQRQYGELIPEWRAIFGIVEQPHSRAAPAIHGFPQRHGFIRGDARLACADASNASTAFGILLEQAFPHRDTTS